MVSESERDVKKLPRSVSPWPKKIRTPRCSTGPRLVHLRMACTAEAARPHRTGSAQKPVTLHFSLRVCGLESHYTEKTQTVTTLQIKTVPSGPPPLTDMTRKLSAHQNNQIETNGTGQTIKNTSPKQERFSSWTQTAGYGGKKNNLICGNRSHLKLNSSQLTSSSHLFSSDRSHAQRHDRAYSVTRSNHISNHIVITLCLPWPCTV